MELVFRTRRLQRSYERYSAAVRAWGPVVGERYRERVALLYDAASVESLYSYRALDFHPLTGNRTGQHALRLTGQWRLIVTILSDYSVAVEEVSNHYE